MPKYLQTIIVFVPFAIMGLALVTLVVFWLYDRIRPMFDNRFVDDKLSADDGRGSLHASRASHGASRGVSMKSISSIWSRLRAWFRSLLHKLLYKLLHKHNEDDAETEDLGPDTTALLAMLPEATVVVNSRDEVIRANPDAYMLGVVHDESIVDDTVREAIHEVRRVGGRKQFDLTTHTPERTMAIAHSDNDTNDTTEDTDSAATAATTATDRAAIEVRGVARPNWLKITVGKVGDFVVVLINDVSEAIRFAQVRDSFISNVSEQLLKPSQALEQLSDALANDVMDPEQISWYAHEVSASCGRLNHMVADLMLLIEAQEPVAPSSANRLNVMEQVRLACERLHADADRYGITVNIGGDDSLTVNGDAGQVTAAVAKLVQNALVYSPTSGVVNVAVSRSDDGSQAVIEVVDQGVGIAKDEQSRIFERFYRGHNQTMRSRGGIGLGLAIVKHVALTHHGNVSVWSAPGSGATFTFCLPLAQ
ncbi:Histidine kinase-, DNA gyrase B-, and HSP90-like ATPase [Bifidobacterium hapali]|uniref:Sensor-like histidine kinase SenX3 n=1 Tax=Bifidobacterium hapali TaxID=1630172 RepID=A0A261FUZ2_9BIFI|nr:ATP-binding protein [Bifidobacterium hapali]OZG62928.1 Histidine kinase-, DNA gyrase B-, and HSP90-like ATPase [Bifidobacterium hapali]